jgi:valyl-tRNA synthetase
MGLRHQLSEIMIMNPDGTMADNAGKYAGMNVVKPWLLT